MAFWNMCLWLRPSPPGQPTVYSGDPGLGQQCVAGRPLCLFGTRLPSCLIDNSLPTWMLAAFRCSTMMIVPSRPLALASHELDLEVH